MASSIYLYISKQDYDDYYRGKTDQLIHQIPIIDMYVDGKNHQLFVVTNQDMDTKNIDFGRTIVHVRNEGLRGDVVAHSITANLVEHSKLIFNGKTSHIDFFPRFLRKPMYSQRVDRVLGGCDPKKYEINYDYKFYDFAQDRINLILGEPKSGLFSQILR